MGCNVLVRISLTMASDEVYDNGSYQLKDIDGTIHERRVNGWRLKQYLNRGPTYLHNVNEELDDDATDQNVVVKIFVHRRKTERSEKNRNVQRCTFT